MSRRSTAMAVMQGEAGPAALSELTMYAARPNASPRSADTLGDYLDAIYRRRLPILAAMVLCVGAAYIVTKRMPRLYEGTATLDIERMTPSGLVGPELSTQVAPDMDQVVATHMRMIQSEALLRPVAEKYRLIELPLPGAKPEAQGPVRMKNLRIGRPPGTYLIQVSYRAPQPELAAAVANEVARSYVVLLDDERRQQWAVLSGSTHRQLNDLNEKMERSNRALLEFQRTIGMVDPEDKTNVLAARLIQLNTEVAKAQSDRAAKEALYQTLASGAPEAAEAAVQGEQVKALLLRRGEAQQKFADAQSIYGDRNPEYSRARAQLEDIDSQLTAAYKKVVKRVQEELRETRLREANLNVAYRRTKVEADAISSRAAEYRLLRQRADADRQLFDELTRKVGEAEINAKLRAAPVRIADPAVRDPRPASPSVALNCALALFGSLMFGCCAAVVYDIKRARYRTVDELRAVTGAEVVTALPSVRVWRGRSESLTKVPLKPPDAEVLRFREQIKRLRNAFNQAMGSELPRVIVVVSPQRADGRSRIAAEFGQAYSALGQRTLLVDADLRSRRPRAPEGLSTSLSGDTRWSDTLLFADGLVAPDVLPSGPPDERASELVHRNLAQVVDEAARAYDVVVIDSPPFLKYSESLDIVSGADAVIVVARAGHTEPKQFEAMLRYLRRMNARVGAVVLNDVDNG
jgi:polysaccharide biosynthesis transport protein